MSELLRIVIADDEAAARSRIRKLLDRRAGFRVVAEAASGKQAVEAVLEHAPDVLFLDVQMPGLDGFAVIEHLPRARLPAVVFVTAYDQYALRAFEAQAVDYLLKPFDDERFTDALANIERRIREGRSDAMREALIELMRHARDAGRGEDEALGGDAARGAERTQEDRAPGSGDEAWAGRVERPGVVPEHARHEPPLARIAVPERDRIVLVEVADIAWIEAAGDYACLHAGAARHLVRSSLAELERKLGGRFVRIHRSALVRKDAVRHLEPRTHGDYDVTLADGTRLKLTRQHREAFARALGLDL